MSIAPRPTKRQRPPGSGRKAGGADGAVREKYRGFKQSDGDRKVIDDLLQRHGFPASGSGIRDFLLDLAAKAETPA